MPDKSWKRAERAVAKKLGGARNPLSGRSGGHSSGDVIHSTLYVEVKQRAHFALFTLFRDTAKKARKEGKTPVVVLHERGRKTRLYIVSEKTLLELLKSSHKEKE